MRSCLGRIDYRQHTVVSLPTSIRSLNKAPSGTAPDDSQLLYPINRIVIHWDDTTKHGIKIDFLFLHHATKAYP